MADDTPSRPVGSKQYRVTKAIHWHFTTEKTKEEIGGELGVSRQKVHEYITSPPAGEVEQALAHQETQTRLVAFEELKSQLRRAGSKSKTAETPVKVWPEDGEVKVTDVTNDDGDVLEKVPIPEGFEMGADDTARYFRREEVREILELMMELTGAKADEDADVEVNISGEMFDGLTEYYED